MKKMIIDDEFKEAMVRYYAEAICERCEDCKACNLLIKEDCKGTDCELYQFRDGDASEDWAALGEAIHKYCWICCDGSVYEVCRCFYQNCSLWAYRMNDLSCMVDSAEELLKLHRSMPKEFSKFCTLEAIKKLYTPKRPQ